MSFSSSIRTALNTLMTNTEVNQKLMLDNYSGNDYYTYENMMTDAAENEKGRYVVKAMYAALHSANYVYNNTVGILEHYADSVTAAANSALSIIDNVVSKPNTKNTTGTKATTSSSEGHPVLTSSFNSEGAVTYTSAPLYYSPGNSSLYVNGLSTTKEVYSGSSTHSGATIGLSTLSDPKTYAYPYLSNFSSNGQCIWVSPTVYNAANAPSKVDIVSGYVLVSINGTVRKNVQIRLNVIKRNTYTQPSLLMPYSSDTIKTVATTCKWLGSSAYIPFMFIVPYNEQPGDKYVYYTITVESPTDNDTIAKVSSYSLKNMSYTAQNDLSNFYLDSSQLNISRM